MPDLDDATLREFIDIVFDAACARPASDFVEPDRVLAMLDRALAPDRVSRWQARFMAPQRVRLLEAAKASAVTLGAWLPDDVRDTIAEMLGAPVRVPKRMVDEMVASEQVRDSVRTLLADAMTSFLKGEGTAGGLGAAIGFGARAVGAAGRGIFGGIADTVQNKLQDRVREFVDGSVAVVQKRIVEKVTSDETARALGKRRRAAFLGLLAKTEAESAKTVLRTPFDKLDPLVPKVVAHNLARAEVRAVVLSETRAMIDEMSKQPIGALLDEMGMKDLLREAVHVHGLPFARELVRSPGFDAWWSRATQRA